MDEKRDNVGASTYSRIWGITSRMRGGFGEEGKGVPGLFGKYMSGDLG